jgi:hypothetical protein
MGRLFKKPAGVLPGFVSLGKLVSPGPGYPFERPLLGRRAVSVLVRL